MFLEYLAKQTSLVIFCLYMTSIIVCLQFLSITLRFHQQSDKKIVLLSVNRSLITVQEYHYTADD